MGDSPPLPGAHDPGARSRLSMPRARLWRGWVHRVAHTCRWTQHPPPRSCDSGSLALGGCPPLEAVCPSGDSSHLGRSAAILFPRKLGHPSSPAGRRHDPHKPRRGQAGKLPGHRPPESGDGGKGSPAAGGSQRGLPSWGGSPGAGPAPPGVRAAGPPCTLAGCRSPGPGTGAAPAGSTRAGPAEPCPRHLLRSWATSPAVRQHPEAPSIAWHRSWGPGD